MYLCGLKQCGCIVGVLTSQTDQMLDNDGCTIEVRERGKIVHEAHCIHCSCCLASKERKREVCNLCVYSAGWLAFLTAGIYKLYLASVKDCVKMCVCVPALSEEVEDTH